MSAKPNILVIGSTGMIGRPVTRALVNAGYPVTLLTRNRVKTETFFPGTPYITGDIFNRDQLRVAMQGQDILYLNLSVAQSSKEKHLQPEREGLSNIIAMARETGIRRIAYLSSLVKNYQGMNGFNWWCFSIKHKAVEAIRSSGIPCSIFYPSTFMETLDRQMLRGKNLMLVKGSEAKMWFIAGDDYGRQVAKAFEIAGTGNQEYIIQGETGYNWHEAADIFVRNYERKVRVLAAPLGMLKFLGLFSQKINYGARICEALNKYPEKMESQRTWQELGKPGLSLESYVRRLP